VRESKLFRCPLFPGTNALSGFMTGINAGPPPPLSPPPMRHRPALRFDQADDLMESPLFVRLERDSASANARPLAEISVLTDALPTYFFRKRAPCGNSNAEDRCFSAARTRSQCFQSRFSMARPALSQRVVKLRLALGHAAWVGDCRSVLPPFSILFCNRRLFPPLSFRLFC